MPEMTEEKRMNNAVRCLRLFIRDSKALNRLLLGEFESSDAELRLAIVNAIRDWNSTPPFLGNVSLKNHPAKHLLLEKAAYEAIRSAGIWHSREHMPSSDGGTSADDHAKAGEYTMWLERLEADYERKKADQKTAQNIANALGNMGVPSEYSYYYILGDDFVF